MTETHEHKRVDRNALESFSIDVLEAAGVTPYHARRVAEGLVHADLRGVDSHGVARLETYVEKFVHGGFNPDPNIEADRRASSVVVVDADHGPGQSAGIRAMDEAMACASETGIAASFVTNSNHFGTAAFFTQHAADQDFVGIAMSNVGSDVIPFGGVTPFLGTNPISIAIPSDRWFPITLDMATSVVAMGKIDHVAREENSDLPPDWAVNANGESTTNPHDVAALRPAGGPKGYGLAFMVDVFCGMLADASVSPDVGALYDDFGDPMRLGHTFLAIDISTLIEPELFRSAVGAYVDRLKDEPTQAGVEEIMVPGEPEARRRRENEAAGVPVREATEASLERLAERFGLEPV